MEAEKPKICESARWRASGLVLVWVWRREDEESWQAQSGGWQTWDPGRVDVSRERQEKASPSWKPGRQGEFPFLGGESAFLFCSILQFYWRRPPTLGRAICLTQIINSNMELIQKYSHRITQNNVWPNTWALCGPVKSTPKTKRHRSLSLGMLEASLPWRQKLWLGQSKMFSPVKQPHCFGLSVALCRPSPLARHLVLVII